VLKMSCVNLYVRP